MKQINQNIRLKLYQARHQIYRLCLIQLLDEDLNLRLLMLRTLFAASDLRLRQPIKQRRQPYLVFAQLLRRNQHDLACLQCLFVFLSTLRMLLWLRL